MSLEPIPPPSGFERFGRLGAVIALVVLAGIGVVAGASFLGRQVGQTFANGADAGADVEPGLDVEVVIPAGASAQDIAAILAAQGVVASAPQFEATVRSAGAAGELRAGSYELITGMESEAVLDVLRSGPIAEVMRITIREGLRVGEVISRLAEESGSAEEDFVTVLESGAVSTSLRDMGDSPTVADWEGLLFPDTYEFVRTATPADMLQRMASTMEQRVGSVDWDAFEAAGFDVYEGIVIASLIESEVRVADERPLVASVIANRLEEGMPLQIDATVLYALGTRDPAEFNNEVDSPFNTYAVTGLPPTPISGPGLAALQAAAAPADTDFLYYVLSDAEGGHTFTTNLDDHNAAVNQAREDGILP
jgi:UPF0755 protein